MDEWVVLKTFDSESEARVVESYLTARGIEVQLLDTHSHGFAPVKGLLTRQGLRLIVRESQVAEAEEALSESAPTHLSLVGEPPKVGPSHTEKIILVVLVLLLILAFAIRGFH